MQGLDYMTNLVEEIYYSDLLELMPADEILSLFSARIGRSTVVLPQVMGVTTVIGE
jgi:hypothetical protein